MNEANTYQEWVAILKSPNGDGIKTSVYETWASSEEEAREDAIFNSNSTHVGDVLIFSREEYNKIIRSTD